MVSFAVGGCDALTSHLALTEAEASSDGVQMALDCRPRVSLALLSSCVLCVNLYIDADMDVLVLIVKSRWLSDADLEGLEILSSSFIRGAQRDFPRVSPKASSGRREVVISKLKK